MPAAEELSDPYANPDKPTGTKFDLSTLPPSALAPPAPDFLFPETDFDESYRRSWGERLTFHIGAAYLVGLTGGGIYGLAEGIKNTQGERRRIRVNGILNSTGRLGPGWGNSLGCLAMMCSIFEGVAFNARGGVDDIFNPAGAAALTGVIYKMTSGPKAACAAGLGLGAMAAAGSLAMKQLSARGILRSIF